MNNHRTQFLTVLLGLLLISTHALSQVDSSIYKTYGGIFEDAFERVISDDNADLIFAGGTSSPNDFSKYAYLVKTDVLLNHEWSVIYGDHGNTYFTDVCEHDGTYTAVGHILNASSSYDVLVVNFNEDGQVIWDKYFGGNNWDFGNSIDNCQGGFIIAGETYSDTNGGSDGYILKVDYNGNVVWEKKFGTDLNEALYDGHENLAGDIRFCGKVEIEDGFSKQWIISTDANGEFIFDFEYGDEGENVAYSIFNDPQDLTYFYVGQIYNTDTESIDASLFSMTQNSTIDWINLVAAPGIQSYREINLGKSNELLCSGFSVGGGFGDLGEDYFYKRMTQTGIYIDQGSYGTAENERAASAIRIEDAYILAGKTDGLGQGQDDAFIVRTKSNGDDTNHSIVECLEESYSNILTIEDEVSSSCSVLYDEISRGIIVEGYCKADALYDLQGKFLQNLRTDKFINSNIPHGVYLVLLDSGRTEKVSIAGY